MVIPVYKSVCAKVAVDIHICRYLYICSRMLFLIRLEIDMLSVKVKLNYNIGVGIWIIDI